MEVTGQFSLYPLATGELGPPLAAAIAAARATGVTVDVGRMSSMVTGTEEQVFAALRAAFLAVAHDGEAVLVATISNAC